MADEEPHSLLDHLAEYVREPTLWPVLLVAIAIFVTLGTAVLLSALRARNPFALLALLLLAGMSGDVAFRELRSRGPGPACGIVLAFWGLSGACAVGAIALGWY